MATAQQPSAARFGTFAGVFTPNVLTILGIILFLRMGWVVGQAGLIGALTIVVIANLISLMTGLSLSAIATNMTVRAGGNYYLISRSLGLEIGGAIGIPLYLSQAISVAFYIIGFTEALQSIAFFAAIDARIIATVVTVIFSIIAYVGADFALKIQFFILAILVAALGSFFGGGADFIANPNFQPSYTDGVNFWVVFAVFFPAVTGIEVGTSLSGDLKDPSRAIPVGTISSIIVTAIVYILVVFWFAYNSTADALINNNLEIQNIAAVPIFVLAGVWASTLSSALGSVIAAPRTLQAIGRDDVLPHWFTLQFGSKTEPRAAVLVTAGVAIAVIWTGNLNVVAPIITMFFLNTYGMVNLVASIEKLVGNPSFRPTFRIPWWVPLLGALGCYSAMFLINTPATILAIIASYGVYFLLQRRRIERTWGDVRSGIWFAVSRFALLRLEETEYSSKNWRPNIIVFTGQPHNRKQLVEVARWLSLGRGIVTFFQFIVGDVDRMGRQDLRETAIKNIRKYIEEIDMQAFAQAEIAPDFPTGVRTVVQAHGIGGLQANTVLMGWSRTEGGRAGQVALMRDMVALHKSVLFLKYDFDRGFGKRRLINVWWQGRGGNEDLMLLLVYLISQHRSWQKTEVRLLRVVKDANAVADTRKHMVNLLRNVRVEAEPIIIVNGDKNRPIGAIIAEQSAEADLTVLGMHLPESSETLEYASRLDDLVHGVGTVLLVRNAQREEDLLNPA